MLGTEGLTILSESSKFGSLEEESSEAHQWVSLGWVGPCHITGPLSFTFDYLGFEKLITGF